MEFRVFGCVSAWLEGRRVPLGHARQRSVLAVFLVEANRPIPVDRFVERVWADAAPRKARATLYGYVHQLRGALASSRDTCIVRRSGGYELVVDPAAIDVHRFNDLVSQAYAERNDHAKLDLLNQALCLWSGDPFEALDSPWFTSSRVDLIERRIAVEAQRNDIALSCGLHHELLVPLAAAIGARPMDEHLAGQFMLAAYRSGRQADALVRYDLLRKLLAEELGTTPSPPLQRLHQEILNADPALTPRQPSPAEHLNGSSGIAETWSALHWAHNNEHRFPDV